MTASLTQTRTVTEDVTDILDAIALDTLPDPTHIWWSTSVSERHPGKRYHTSAHCTELWKSKRQLPYERRYSQIAEQLCYLCTRLPALESAYQAQQIRTLHRQMLQFADALGTSEPEDLDRNLNAYEHTLRTFTRQHTDPLGRAASDTFAAALTAIGNRIRDDTVDTNRLDALTTYAAAALLSSRHPGYGDKLIDQIRYGPHTDHDMSMLNTSPTEPLRGNNGGHRALSEAWSALVNALLDNKTLTEAQQAALAAQLPLSEPTAFAQMPATIDIPVGTTSINLAWLMQQWRPQAEKLASDVIGTWVAMISDLVTQSERSGDIQVTVPRDQSHSILLNMEVDKFADAFPTVVHANGHRTLTVPAVVADWLTRLTGLTEKVRARTARPGSRNAQTVTEKFAVTVQPHGDNTVEVLNIASKLTDPATSEPLPLAVALTVARDILR